MHLWPLVFHELVCYLVFDLGKTSCLANEGRGFTHTTRVRAL
jgi:hypothetical protein